MAASRKIKPFFLCISLFLSFSTVAVAQNILTVRDISTGLAAEAAVAAMQDCRGRGFLVSVAVVDRAGISKVLLRDDGAGIGTADGARRKAFTAVTFRTSTLQFAQQIAADPTLSGLADFEGVLILGGGLPILSAAEVIGGIGVGGAPGADIDDARAKEGKYLLSLTNTMSWVVLHPGQTQPWGRTAEVVTESVRTSPPRCLSDPRGS